MNYIRQEFRFSHLKPALVGDPAHFHIYKLKQSEDSTSLQLEMEERFSTDVNGIAECLGLQTSQKMELEEITRILEAKISLKTLFTL